MSKTSKSGTIEVDGMELAWEIRHLGGASNMYGKKKGEEKGDIHDK